MACIVALILSAGTEAGLVSFYQRKLLWRFFRASLCFVRVLSWIVGLPLPANDPRNHTKANEKQTHEEKGGKDSSLPDNCCHDKRNQIRSLVRLVQTQQPDVGLSAAQWCSR